MKKIIVNFVASVLGCVSLAACKSDQTIAAHLAVSYATAKYIEKDGPTNYVQRATRVRAVVDLVASAAAGESVTVDQLKAYVVSKLPPDLSPADKLLATQLISIASEELQLRVGAGVIPPDKLVKVKQVLEWVTEATLAYAPGPE